MNVLKTKKFKDPYLKPIILNAIKKIEEFVWFREKGEQSIYYEGNFQEDVLNNFSKKESSRIFKRMKKYLNDDRLVFLQKKIKTKYVKKLNDDMFIDDTQYYYEYIVSKR